MCDHKHLCPFLESREMISYYLFCFIYSGPELQVILLEVFKQNRFRVPVLQINSLFIFPHQLNVPRNLQGFSQTLKIILRIGVCQILERASIVPRTTQTPFQLGNGFDLNIFVNFRKQYSTCLETALHGRDKDDLNPVPVDELGGSLCLKRSLNRHHFIFEFWVSLDGSVFLCFFEGRQHRMLGLYLLLDDIMMRLSMPHEYY